MALNSRFGTSTPDGKTVPGHKRLDKLAAQAAALAAKRPTQSTVESMEQAEVATPAAPTPAAAPDSRTADSDDAAPGAATPSASPATSPTSATSATPDTSTAATAAATTGASASIQSRPIDAIRTSPFQPKGRPSAAAVDAVRRAIAEAGSLEALTGRD